ncbi:MAG: carbohydrate-binding domain-containing protein [Propionibacteriaceae bacterium]|nr:carbohydrate-binding domain-containing protein [Propionibacteriaceae bacterium]
MRRLKTVLAGLAAVAVLAGCSALPTSSATTDPTTTTSAAGSVTAAEVLAANEDATTVNDDEWSLDDARDITLTGSSATTGADGVIIDESTVTITAAGVYRLSGSLTGQVVVDAPEDALVVLVLDGAEIASSTTAAIAVLNADDVGLYLMDGTSNTLSDTSGYSEDSDVNAALFSEEDLTISGTGSLTVTGNGNDGITGEDDLVILAGTIIVTAVDDGIRGKDSLTVRGGAITVTAGGDGLKADNEDEDTRGYMDLSGGTITVTAADDGLDAETDIVMTGSDVTVTTSGTDNDDMTSKGVDAGAIFVIEDGGLTVTASVEAVEAATVIVAGGTIDLTASDDGINASTGSGESMRADAGAYLEISGGTLTIDAEGDGLDSNGALLISGGTTIVYGPTRGGDGAIDSNGGITITGGTLLAFDTGDMAEAPGDASTQGWLIASASGNAGDTVQVTDASGAVVAEATSRKSFGSVTYSSSAITSGQSYQVVTPSGSTTITAGEGGMGGRGGPGGGGPGGSGPGDGSGGGGNR